MAATIRLPCTACDACDHHEDAIMTRYILRRLLILPAPLPGPTVPLGEAPPPAGAERGEDDRCLKAPRMALRAYKAATKCDDQSAAVRRRGGGVCDGRGIFFGGTWPIGPR
jgi:hypothetical protein